jgi:hypothetical protein
VNCGLRIADLKKNKKSDAEAEIRGKESWQRTARSRQKKKDRGKDSWQLAAGSFVN